MTFHTVIDFVDKGHVKKQCMIDKKMMKEATHRQGRKGRSLFHLFPSLLRQGFLEKTSGALPAYL